MTELEWLELDAEESARADYLHEAYVREVDMLDAQAEDEAAWRSGFTSARAADSEARRLAARARAAASIRCGKFAAEDDVPF